VVVVGAAFVVWGLLNLGRPAVLNLEDGLNLGLVVSGSSVLAGSGRLGNVFLRLGRSVRTWSLLGLSGISGANGDSSIVLGRGLGEEMVRRLGMEGWLLDGTDLGGDGSTGLLGAGLI